MTPDAHTDLIDRYLQGRLSAPEQAAFEARCRQEPAFAEAVRTHALAEYAVRTAATKARYARLQAAWSDLPPQAGRRRHLRPVAWLSMAAAVILLLLLLWPRPTPDLPALYAQYPIEAPFAALRGSAGDTAWAAAATAYTAGEYAAAIGVLETILADTARHDRAKAQFYLGLSYLQLPPATGATETARLAAARAALTSVAPESSYREAALWYLALSYLRAGDAPGARTALARIVAYPHHYRQAEAQALLAQLAED